MLQADVAPSSTYDPRLVALSIAIAVVASYTALDLAGRVTAARSRARLAWLIGGAIVMGIGIWSMHFVAMLAFSLPMPMGYDMLTVLLSMLPAIVASFGALFLASRSVLSMVQLLLGGVLMGIGIASMHYIGMAAMRMEATIRYDPVLFALSVAIAIGASILGLWIAFQLRVQTSKAGDRIKIGSAIVLGAAIAGMHYTGMAAMQLGPPNPTAVPPDTMNGSLTSLGVAIGTATFFILGFALMASFMDRRLAHSAKLLVQLEDSLERSQLFTEITLRIRRSLKLEDVLNTTVNEVRTALKTDRVMIYRFNSNGSGTIIAESVAEGWTKTLGKIVHNPLPENNIEMYRNGHVIATTNVYKVGFTDFYSDILTDFQINASLVAPILNNNQLMGLLCAHQCSGPRSWHAPEIDLFQQLAIQVGIALEQASLLDETYSGQKLLQLQGRAIAAAKVAIFITNSQQPDNPIIFCNPAFETITGYSPPEAIGRNYRFLTGPDTDPATVELLSNAMHDCCECQVTIQNYRKDGTEFWCELTVSPVRDAFGRVINFIGVLADITERQQAQEELISSKKAIHCQLLELLSNLKEATRGDLTVRAEVTTDEIGIVADFFNATIESLRQIVSQVKKAAHQVSAYAVENSTQIQQIADRALLQVEEITRTLEEVNQMNLSIQTVADSARQASVVACTASNTASSASSAIDSSVNSILNLQQTVAQTANKVKSLGESSQKISALGARINEIARETNLLVIDASTEATWLGDLGRGFAAVVEQIGELAVQSALATKEIELICADVQSETSVVVKTIELGTTQVVEKANLVKDAKLSLGQILEVSHQIDRLAQSISTATQSQAQTSVAVATLMKQISLVLERTADSSPIVSALQQTQEVARQLQTSVSQFKTDT